MYWLSPSSALVSFVTTCKYATTRFVYGKGDDDGLIHRMYRYTWALDNQPTHPALESPLIQLAAVVLFAVGGTLVLTSMYALGVTGTYLGKH